MEVQVVRNGAAHNPLCEREIYDDSQRRAEKGRECSVHVHEDTELQTSHGAPADVSLVKRFFRNMVLPGHGWLDRRFMNDILVSLV